TEGELVWGSRGIQDGQFVRPRAVAIDSHDRLYIVDYTARIQVYDRDGNYLGHTWTTPDYRNGRPSGLSIDRDDNLIVSDSHYNCFRLYSHEGVELRPPFGGEVGTGPGQFGYISDVVQDAGRNWYVAEFGENRRITKLDPEGHFLRSWGSEGTEPGQFSPICALGIGPDNLLYATGSCNRRIEVFTVDGDLVRCWGTLGSEAGQLSYPYDLAFGRGGVLYVVEYANNRVQKFTPEGTSLGCWGGPGREPGKLCSPWAL